MVDRPSHLPLVLVCHSFIHFAVDIPGVTIAQAELRLEELLELQHLRHPVSLCSFTFFVSLVASLYYDLYSSRWWTKTIEFHLDSLVLSTNTEVYIIPISKVLSKIINAG
jgi:hypothetical protein